ncbi:hypothetical protein O988_07764 [Pseudogymnoascus sp. VKM F-3808]|nr:hypothetical protein O988_07764 [Pseudogymnoascus sp. VKM F-3808]
MWKSPVGNIDPITISAGAALICSIFTQRLASRQSELWSETLGWVLLPIVYRVVGQRRQQHDSKTWGEAPLGNPVLEPATAASLWLVSLGIVTFCIFRAEGFMIAFFPILTPLLLAAQRYLRSDVRTSADSRFFSPFVNTVWGTAVAALFVIISMLDWNFQWYTLSIVPAAALLVLFDILTSGNVKGSRFMQPFDVENAIIPLAVRVVILLAVLLGVEKVAFDFATIEPLITLTLGLAKALTWYFIIQTARNSSWRTVTTTATFSIISTIDPFAQTLGAQASSHVVASFLALGQVIHNLPRQAAAKSALWIFSLASIVPYIANTVAIHTAQSSLVHSQEHPIAALIHNAKADFESLVERQSKNYSAAHDEYRRRYAVEPPPGFKVWHEYVTLHQSPIIDDFDQLHDSIAPLWKLSGKEVQEITKRVYETPNSDLWLCTFNGDQAQTNCTHPYRTADRNIQNYLNGLFENLRGVLPDVQFLINHLDEPRVIIPPSAGEDSHNKLNGTTNPSTEFTIANMGGQPVWDKLTEFCPAQQNARRSEPNRPVKTYEIPFVTDLPAAMDLCSHPEYRELNGLALSPTSFRLIEGLVPVLSCGAPSTMSDFVYPPAAYIEPGFRYDKAGDVDWDAKRNNLYWAGSTTGGFASDDKWRFYHRQRFVTLAQNLEHRAYYYLSEVGGVVSRVKSLFLNSRLYDVGFSRILQCEKDSCRDQRAFFPTKPWSDKDSPLRSKLVFDLDGNGISGRYYKLLASKSVPLKQTLLREWHDERLVPWVHYIPISQGMEEVPEIVAYLTGTETGDGLARGVAEGGRKWFGKALRDVDRGAYIITARSSLDTHNGAPAPGRPDASRNGVSLRKRAYKRDPAAANAIYRTPLRPYSSTKPSPPHDPPPLARALTASAKPRDVGASALADGGWTGDNISS